MQSTLGFLKTPAVAICSIKGWSSQPVALQAPPKNPVGEGAPVITQVLGLATLICGATNCKNSAYEVPLICPLGHSRSMFISFHTSIASAPCLAMLAA